MSKTPKSKVADYIPDGVIVQILYKLPIKYILRFMCVSKSWLSLIKSRSFISTHRNLVISSSNNNPRLLFRLCYPNSDRKLTEYYSVCSDTKVFNYNPCIHFHFPFKALKFKLVGTVNGLVCLANDIESKTTVIIWNPLLKKFIALPEPMSTCYTCVSYGFGFDFRSDDYKVLRLAQPASGVGDTLEGEVYSFNTNSWKRVCTPSYIIMFASRTAFVNGVVHGMATRVVGDDKSCKLMWGFDVGDETFKEIALPQTLVDQQHMYMELLVYKASIALFEEDWDSDWAHVWVMGQYDVVSSWSKILSFDGQEGTWPKVFGCRRNGELFLERMDSEIVLHDYENTENKSLQVRGISPFVDYFVESLELLDNANAKSDLTVAAGDAIGDAAGDATAAND